jgi:methanogenic corrinoid protein MtbC1
MKKVIAGTLGNCVHVAGIMNYLRLAEDEGYKTKYIGIGKSADEIIEYIDKEKPDIVALSYRLTPEPLREILSELKEKIQKILSLYLGVQSQQLKWQKRRRYSIRFLMELKM